MRCGIIQQPTTSDGLLTSFVTMGAECRVDHNILTTALAVRSLRRSGWQQWSCFARKSALDGLESARSPSGGFRFWPVGSKPSWAPDLPDDTDDTAIVTLELYAAGRWSREMARQVACRTIGMHRLRQLYWPGPPWRRVGAFKTWHRADTETDMIDCTVNANAVALLAALGLRRVPGYWEACAMIDEALAWAGTSEERLKSLSPFYPAPAEFLLALENAVECGANELIPAFTQLQSTEWGRNALSATWCADHAICSSPYGLAIWRSPALAEIRFKCAWTDARPASAHVEPVNTRIGLVERASSPSPFHFDESPKLS
jgi:hypothetical protein